MSESSRFAGAGATDENENDLGVMDVCFGGALTQTSPPSRKL
jgi:hypothetical protein